MKYYVSSFVRVARALRTGTNNGVAGADCSRVLRKGCAKSWTTFTAVTLCASTLPVNPSGIAVQTDSRGC